MRQKIYKRFARVLVEEGVSLEPGEVLIIRAHPGDYMLVREIVDAAYKKGARYVKTEFDDGEISRIRAASSVEEYLDYCPKWLRDYRESYGGDNCCVISLDSPVAAQDYGIAASRMQRVLVSEREAEKGFTRAAATGRVSMVKTAVPFEDWARRVYPDLEKEEAMENLWNDFAHICRLDREDPVKAWELHKREIRERKQILDREKLSRLFLDSSRTHLEIGLVRGGSWIGGCVVNQKNNREYIPNIPTEEIFFVPHKYQINGCVVSTVPLNYKGNLIEGISLEIKDGKVIRYSADKGEDLLSSILETDDGACYFGEVSLVPVSSPVYQTKRVFYDTLLDENATCHMALGKGTPGILKEGYAMTQEEKEKAGINDSSIHVDFMIGSEELDVDGLTEGGIRKPIMRQGDWVL